MTMSRNMMTSFKVVSSGEHDVFIFLTSSTKGLQLYIFVLLLTEKRCAITTKVSIQRKVLISKIL